MKHTTFYPPTYDQPSNNMPVLYIFYTTQSYNLYYFCNCNKFICCLISVTHVFMLLCTDLGQCMRYCLSLLLFIYLYGRSIEYLSCIFLRNLWEDLADTTYFLYKWLTSIYSIQKKQKLIAIFFTYCSVTSRYCNKI